MAKPSAAEKKAIKEWQKAFVDSKEGRISDKEYLSKLQAMLVEGAEEMMKSPREYFARLDRKMEKLHAS